MASTLEKINSIKQKVDAQIQKGSGFVNSLTIDSISSMDLQWKNQFDLLFYQPNILSAGSFGFLFTAANLAIAGLGAQFVRKHAISLTVPQPSIEYERANEKTYAKNLVLPEDFTITFLEDDDLSVFTFLNNWWNVIYTWDNDAQTYLFYDQQDLAKKNIKVFMMRQLGIPGPMILTIEGVRPKSMNELLVGHNEGDPLILQVTFTADKIGWTNLHATAASLLGGAVF